MSRFQRLVTLLGAIVQGLAVMGCAAAAGGTSQTLQRDDLGHETTALTSQLEEIAKLVSGADPRDFPGTYVRYFADDATIVTAPGSVIHGKDSILAFYERVAANLKYIEWRVSKPTVLIDGSLAVLWYQGVTRAIYVGQDSVASVSTRYSDTLRKQRDGSWKIMLHAWVRD